MALNEVMAHIEIMEECGDICLTGEKKDMAQGTGLNNFLGVMTAYLH